jgi:alpha-beta hydrolase superfamily lysophospholipase
MESEISNDEAFVSKRAQDGRCYHGQTMNKSAYEILKMVKVAKEAVPTIKVPFLAVHGKTDQICIVESAQYLHDRSGTAKAKKSLVIIENCKHHPDYEVESVSSDFVAQVSNYVESFLMDSLTLPEIEAAVN